jgi:hypothetical protein
MIVEGEGKVLSAFHSALGAIEGVTKTEVGGERGGREIRYAGLNAVLAECSRACEMFGLVIVQEPSWMEGLFAVSTSLIHDDGSMLHFAAMCLPMPKDAQALGSATTYLRRYSLVSIFGIPVEDDDGKAATTSAQTQPGRRTEAERMIREEMAGLHPDVQKEYIEAFKTEFRCSLTDLPASQHGRALTWTREWIHTPIEEPEKPDEGSVTEPTTGG